MAEVRDALRHTGVSQRQFAKALGKADSRISEWLAQADDALSSVTTEHLARAVAALTGTLAVTPLDLIELTTGPLAHLEGLAHEMLDVIAQTRARLGAGAPAAIPDAALAGSATAALSAAKNAGARGRKAPRRANHG